MHPILCHSQDGHVVGQEENAFYRMLGTDPSIGRPQRGLARSVACKVAPSAVCYVRAATVARFIVRIIVLQLERFELPIEITSVYDGEAEELVVAMSAQWSVASLVHGSPNGPRVHHKIMRQPFPSE